MPSIVIRNLEPVLHERLKQAARQHHRSMSKHIIVLLEKGVDEDSCEFKFPEPFRAKKRLTQSFLDKAINEDRE